MSQLQSTETCRSIYLHVSVQR